jgi:hypothetical protein
MSKFSPIGVCRLGGLLHLLLHEFLEKPELELEIKLCAEGLRKGGFEF